MAKKRLTKEEKMRLKEEAKLERERKKYKKQNAKERGKGVKIDATRSIVKTIAIIVTVAVVLGLFGIYGSSYGIPARYMPAIKIGTKNVDAPTWSFNFYFLYRQMYQYASMLGLDTTKTLFGQMSPYTKDEKEDSPKLSWEDYFTMQVNTSLQNEFALYNEAKAAGVKLSKENSESIETQMKELKEQASSYAMSVGAYLRNNYVPGITAKKYRDIQERTLLVEQFNTQKKDEYRNNHNAAEIKKIYESDPSAYNLVDFRVYAFPKTKLQPMDGESELETNTRQARADDEVLDKANELLRKSNTEADFIAAADVLGKAANPASETTAAYDAKTATLNIRQSKDTVKAMYTDEKLVDKVFSSERKAGETFTFETDGNVFAFYMLKPSYAQTTVDLYTINFDAEVDQETGSVDPAKMEEAKKNADNLLKTWKEKGSTKEAFVTLVDQQHTLDTAADPEHDHADEETPGFTEKVGPGTTGVTEVEDWAFDDARKQGEAAVIATANGFKVVYLSSINKSDFVWMKTIADELVEKDYEAYLNELHKKYPLDGHGIGIRFALDYSQKMCDNYMLYAQQQQAMQ